MAGVERVAVHVSRLAHCPAVFFVEFSRAGSVGNLVVPLDRSEAEALRDELGEALSGRITAEIFSLSHWLGVPSDALLGLKPLEVA